MPVKIFFCYAHEDEALLNQLKKHLRPLQRQGLIDVWHDRDIMAGTEWEQEISEQLDAAQMRQRNQRQWYIMTAEPAKIIKIYYCYAQADHLLRDELEKQLSPLRRLKQVTWSDCDILAGTNWEQEIEARIDSAHLILLLISPDFIASDQCYTVEMQQALERQQVGEAYVVPIILRPVYWAEAPFSRLPVLPRSGRPVTQWRDRDDALLDVAQGVREIVKTLIASQALSAAETRILEQIGRITKTDILDSLPDSEQEQAKVIDPLSGRIDQGVEIVPFPKISTPQPLQMPPHLTSRNRLADARFCPHCYCTYSAGNIPLVGF